MFRSSRTVRVALGVAVSALLAGGLVSAFAADAPCSTYTDPAADSGPGATPATNAAAGDNNLDLVAITHSVTGDEFSTIFKVVKLLDTGPDLAFGDRFRATFTVAGKVITVTAERDFLLGENKAAATVAGTAVTFPVKLLIDVKASTIGAVLSAAALEKAVGSPLNGQPFTSMSATAGAIYPSNATSSVTLGYDSATAPATASYIFGTPCGGGAAPAPTTAAASGSPSPAASSSASASPTASASASASGAPASTMTPLPIPGCVLALDPKGDAKALNANNPNSDPDLDITELTLGTVGTDFVAYAKVNKLATGPTMSTDGHRFTFSFVHNKNVFALAGSAYKTAASATVKNTLASTGQFSAVTQLSVNGPPLTDPNSRTNPGFVKSGLKFTFDLKNSYVIASLPIADIEKYGKAPFAGAELTLITATSATDTTVVSSQADIIPDGAPTTKPSTLTYTGGDSRCFPVVSAAAPPATATSLIATAPRRVQTSDQLPVSVTFTGGDGKPKAGSGVTARLGNGPSVSGKTDSKGKAKLSVPVTGPAGTRALVVTSGGTTVRRTTTVVAERSLLDYTISGEGDTRLITVTLTDDDRTRHPYAGEQITFAYDRMTMTATTDKSGQAFVRVPNRTKIDITYAGKPGLVTSAKRQTPVS